MTTKKCKTAPKKRKPAPEQPFKEALQKTESQFIADYLGAKWLPQWTHPKTGDEYSIEMINVPGITSDDLLSCFNLIKETSEKDYQSSSDGWDPTRKRLEMAEPGLRYILVKDKSGAIRGFTSLLPTFEEGEPVIYCYEIHLKPELRGTGIASLLMDFHVEIARNLPPITKVMLTVFRANQRATKFYTKLGFEEDTISPQPRKLRSGTDYQPSYMIMSKRVRADDDARDKRVPADDGSKGKRIRRFGEWNGQQD